jgi:autotransporter-associated beta strand protein
MDMLTNIIFNNNNPIIKTGTGTFIYRASNINHINITINDGRFEMEAAGVLTTTSGITVNAPGIVDMNGRNQNARFIAGNGTITNEGLVATATLSLNNATGETHNFSGNLLLGTATRINLAKTNSGTQILSGNNTYNGLTTVTSGTLEVAHNNALGTANLNPGTTITAGATLALSGGITVSDTIHFTGTGVSNLGAIRNLSGTNTITAPVSPTAASNRIQAEASSTLIFANTAVFNPSNSAGRGLTFGGNGNFDYQATINATSGLTKEGTGTLILSGNNSYNAGTTISAGTIRLGAATGLSPLNVLSIGASSTLDVNGFSVNIASLAAAPTTANITSSAAGNVLLTVGSLSSPTSYAGTINTGSATTLSLRKIGSASLTLSNANSTYNGTTVISAGSLFLVTSKVRIYIKNNFSLPVK